MRLELGDCLEVLKTIPDNSVDSIVTDPPYGISFMSKKWDYDVPSVEIWIECLRVLKPGGHLLSFAGSRTYHRMAVRIEDAGFEIRDQIMWIYGSGFPKSHNIGKAVDKLQGNEREVLGTKAEFSLDGAKRNPNNHREIGEAGKEIQHEYGYKQGWDTPVTKGQSEWEGWGTALKPAHEPIVLARKPLSEKSVALNVLKWGTGGLNIDVSRVEFEDTPNAATNPLYRQQNDYKMPEKGQESNGSVSFTSSKNDISTLGRFPANIIFDEEAGLILDEQSGITKTTPNNNYKHSNTETDSNTFTSRGTYTPREDKGGASRFFYCPKTSKKDRDEGLDEFEEKAQRQSSGGSRDFNARCANCGKKFIGSPETICKCDNPITDNTVFKKKNNHPTVKPTALMEYLIKLVTPVKGLVLDCFLGSGSTGKGAIRNGFDFIGIEREEEYMRIAEARIKNELIKIETN